MVRDYIVRFWKRMLTMGKTEADILLLKEAGTITEAEYNAILGIS